MDAEARRRFEAYVKAILVASGQVAPLEKVKSVADIFWLLGCQAPDGR